MRQATKQLLREWFTHGAAFGGGMLFQQLREKLRSPELEGIGGPSSAQDLNEIREVLGIVHQVLERVEPIAEAQAIVLGVLAEVIRTIPSIAARLELAEPDATEIEKMAHAHVSQVMRSAVHPRADLDDLIDLAATVVAVYTRNAIASPGTSIPTSVSPTVRQLVATGTKRLATLGSNDVVSTLKEHTEQLEALCAGWRQQGRPETHWVTLQHIIDAARQPA
jgi:hypothetical protein